MRPMQPAFPLKCEGQGYADTLLHMLRPGGFYADAQLIVICRLSDKPWQPGFDLLMENALDSSMPLPLSSDSHLHLLKVRAVRIQQTSSFSSPSYKCMPDRWQTLLGVPDSKAKQRTMSACWVCYMKQLACLQAMCSRTDGNQGLKNVYIMPRLQESSPSAAMTALQLECLSSTAWRIPACPQQQQPSMQVPPSHY